VGSCAAATFFDSFAHHKSSGNGGFVASINRDADGDAAFSDLFGPILDHSFTRVVVSPGELPGSSAPTGEPDPGHLFTRELLEKNEPLDMKYQRSELSSEYIAPRNALENVIAGIWQEFLGIEQVGIEDDFFELRSDSLVFITIAAKIHKALNVKVPIDVFFSKPTIKEMAEYINDAGEELFTSIESVEKKEYYAPSPAQKRLFVLHRLEPENTDYNVPLVLYLEKAEKAKLDEAFIKLIRRHASLRTSFHMIEGQLMQKVRETVEFTCQYSTAQSTIHDHREKINMEIEDIIRNIMRPFDLSYPPLMRVRLVKVSETRDLLLINLHHIITDGVSQSILGQDFMKLYAGRELPSMRLQYKDYSEWWNLEKQQELVKHQETYWLKTFESGIPAIRLPLDSSSADIRDFAKNALTFEIDTRDTLALKKALEKEGMTLTIPLLAIYYVLLAKYSGQEDLIIGIATAGRTHDDLQNIVGMFVNMLPVRNQPSEDKTFASFLNEVNENVLKAYENQDYPYEELIKKLKLQRSPGRDPLISACFTRRHYRNHDMEKEELQVSLHPYEGKTAIFLLNLEFAEEDGTIKLRLRYFANLFKESTIRTIIRHYREALRQVLENMNIKLKDIKIASNLTSTKKNVLPDFNKDFDF
jgi:acyl carrier protein